MYFYCTFNKLLLIGKALYFFFFSPKQSADASKLIDNRINLSGFKTCLEVLDRFQEFDYYMLEMGGPSYRLNVQRCLS